MTNPTEGERSATPRVDEALYAVVRTNEDGETVTESWVKPDFARTLERDLTAARQRIEGLEADLRKETRRADAWVTAARDLSRELGVADEDSNGSIHDWRHIRSVLTMRESRLAAVEAERDALSDIYWVVQYRRKHEGIQWQNMAAFDFELAAKNYAEKCGEGDVPWEYRCIHKDAIRHLKEKS